jgi:hypothetical protein
LFGFDVDIEGGQDFGGAGDRDVIGLREGADDVGVGIERDGGAVVDASFCVLLDLLDAVLIRADEQVYVAAPRCEAGAV